MANQNQPNPPKKDQTQFDDGKAGNRPQSQEQGRHRQDDQYPGEERRHQEDQRSQGHPQPDAERDQQR
jgi:hypothetical protein